MDAPISFIFCFRLYGGEDNSNPGIGRVSKALMEEIHEQLVCSGSIREARNIDLCSARQGIYPRLPYF
jgi:hypothetical protein